MTKVNLTVAQLRDNAESLYAMCYMTNADADVTLVDLIADTETSIFLIECTDALCEVRIIENRSDEDDYEVIVTVLSKVQCELLDEVIADAKVSNSRASRVFLQYANVL